MSLPCSGKVGVAGKAAKPSAKNINTVLMAIPRQQFVPLQSKYLFHLVSPFAARAAMFAN
jgi:hypothetical protein